MVIEYVNTIKVYCQAAVTLGDTKTLIRIGAMTSTGAMS